MPPRPPRPQPCCARRSGCGAGPRSRTSPMRTSRSRPSHGWKSCGSRRSSAGSKPISSWPPRGPRRRARCPRQGASVARADAEPAHARPLSVGPAGGCTGSYHEARATLVDELGIEPGPVLHQLERAILRQDPSLDLAGTTTTGSSSPGRRARGGSRRATACSRRAARPEADPGGDRCPPRRFDTELAAANDLLRATQEELVKRGTVARTACFTTRSEAGDAIRLATEQEADLLLLAGGRAPLEDPVIRAVLVRAPCDVGVLVGRDDVVGPGPVLVPFGGSEHDWTAIELGAWLAGALDVPSGSPGRGRRSATRVVCSQARRSRHSAPSA